MDVFENIIATAIGRAAMQPLSAQRIYKQTAQAFMGYARNPRNAGIAQDLLAVASRFDMAANRPGSISDFRDLLRERAQAYEEVGDYSEDMDPLARAAEIHEERTPGLPRVSIAPKSVNQNTRLGDQVWLKFQPTDDEFKQFGYRQSETLAFWQGEKPEAQAVTVDVGIIGVLPNEGATGTNNRPYGIVGYGSDGTLINVKFDIGYGTRFTVIGSFVSVLVAMAEPRSDFASVPVKIGASIGFFAAPSLAPVMFTEYIDGLSNVGPANVSPPIPRPAKAMQLLPMQSNVVGGTATIRFLGLDGSTPQYVIGWTNSAQNIPIPLTDDIAFIQVVNTGATTATFRLPFQLAM